MTTPTIRRLDVRAVRLPMPRPHRTAGGTVAESPLVLLDLESSDGVVGHAYVFTYTVLALASTATLVRNLAPPIVGQPLVPFGIDRLLSSRSGCSGRKGWPGSRPR